MNDWKVESFTASQIHQGIENDSDVGIKFRVPPYQRGLVWSPGQKEAFIDTLKKGLPFGTLLLYKEKDEYQIIDGYQRSSTIYSFINEPSKFFDQDDINLSDLKQLSQLGTNSTKQACLDKVQDHIIKWVHQSFKTMDEVKDIQYQDYVDAFISDFPLANGSAATVRKLIQPTLKSFKDLCERLCDVEIPAITITGNSEYLPTIFERINSKGTQLSKYQIYAATWTKTYDIKDDDLKDIIKYNRERYEEMSNNGIEVAEFDSSEFIVKKKLNLFEIAFGFGKYIGSEFPHLFNVKKDINGVDSVGFSLINSCLGKNNSDSKSMHDTFENVVGNDNVCEFLKKIILSIKAADKIVAKYNTFKLNSKGVCGPLHSEFQIISLISNIFIYKYADFDKDDKDNIINFSLHLDIENPNWKNYSKSLSSNAGKKYILDIINQKWKGSGDKKLDNVIFDWSYYTQDISWDDFKEFLKQWYNASNMDKNEHKRISLPQESEKLFLTMVYLNHFSAADAIDNSKYDIEHLATKNLMKQALDRYGDDAKLPIGSIANLCLLPFSENRSKKDKTIYDDDKYLTNSIYTLSDIEAKFTFTEVSDFDWIKNSIATFDIFRDSYLSYLDKRFNKYLDMLEKNYSNF